MSWLNRVKREFGSDPSVVVLAFEYFERKVNEGAQWLSRIQEAKPKDQIKVRDVGKSIPHMMTLTFNHAQEADAIKEWLSDRASKRKAEAMRHFKEHYKRELNDSAAKTYADADDDYLTLRECVQLMEMVSDQLGGLSKGLEAMHFQVGNIIRMHEHGLEEILM